MEMEYEILEGKFSLRGKTSQGKEVSGTLTISSDGKISFEPSQSNEHIPVRAYCELVENFFDTFEYSNQP